MRFGIRPLITVGLASTVIGYALFLPIGLDSAYATAIFPTMIFAGLGFALAYGPLNIAATNGVAPEEQGLASGLVNTSFQVGGALVLAVATAVATANTGSRRLVAGAARRLPGRGRGVGDRSDARRGRDSSSAAEPCPRARRRAPAGRRAGGRGRGCVAG